MPNSIRVRFAPSPTGDPHLGNIRTALFNWLYARHTGGKFILRIEDTDQARISEGALEAIFDSLQWLGLDWDEGPRVGGPYDPYVQSERLATYQETAERLVQEGYAYYCYCTSDELALMRQEQQQKREPIRYNRRCRHLSQAEHQANGGKPRVVRFMTPLEGDPITVHDTIRGDVAFDPSSLDDFILLKSDRYPTYHLANVLDDHTMQISHVLRAEEWLPSAPRHVLLYRALGYEPPQFGHLPMILGPDRTKLSKRHGATSLLDYRNAGFLPEAVRNFLALLGWSLDDKTEIFSMEELVQHFSLERVGKSAAIFDSEKLTWMNGVYLRQLPADGLAKRLAETLQLYIQHHQPPIQTPPSQEYMETVVPLVQERLKTLNQEEVWDLCSFFLVETPEYQVDPPVPKGLDIEATRVAIQAAIDALRPMSLFDAETIEQVLRPLTEQLQLRTRELFGAIRIAVTGRTAAPPLFDTLAVLGKDRVLARLDHAAAKLAPKV